VPLLNVNLELRDPSTTTKRADQRLEVGASVAADIIVDVVNNDTADRGTAQVEQRRRVRVEALYRGEDGWVAAEIGHGRVPDALQRQWRSLKGASFTVTAPTHQQDYIV
jgi:hypothetical protein